MKNLLPCDGYASLIEDVFSEEEAESYLSSLKSSVEWQTGEITIFGKKVMQPRLFSLVGDQDTTYKYSGKLLNSKRWPREALSIKEKAEELSRAQFNCALLNYYRNGNDSMGCHRDNEPELGPDFVIGSISLGEKRKFVFKHKTKKLKIEIWLPHNSLLIMKGADTQKFWYHSLPKTKKFNQPRVNITFRKVN